MYEFQNYVTQTYLKNKNIKHLEFKKNLVKLLGSEVPIRNHYQLNFILKNYSKHDYILDYGCGSGLILAYLKLYGYKNIYGADIHSHKIRDFLYTSLNFNSDEILLIKDKLPYEDSKFDLVISNTVLEHVKNIELYYSETSRVLKKNSYAFLIFPHRLKPFDSHSQSYFIHYFPKFIRKFLYENLTIYKSKDIESRLNLKTPFYHFKIARRYFQKVENLTEKRLKTTFEDSWWDGNIKLRIFLGKVINLPVLKLFLPKLASYFSQLSLLIKK